MCMSFFIQGSQVELKGIHSKPWQKAFEPNSLHPTTFEDMQLQTLLVENVALFDQPTGMPPSRCDYRIPLHMWWCAPIDTRGQKDEIGHQCAAMLQQGIIRPSRSPFSSPVILALKADNS